MVDSTTGFVIVIYNKNCAAGWHDQVVCEAAGHHPGRVRFGDPDGGDQRQAVRPHHVRGGDHLRQTWPLLCQRESGPKIPTIKKEILFF